MSGIKRVVRFPNKVHQRCDKRFVVFVLVRGQHLGSKTSNNNLNTRAHNTIGGRRNTLIEPFVRPNLSAACMAIAPGQMPGSFVDSMTPRQTPISFNVSPTTVGSHYGGMLERTLLIRIGRMTREQLQSDLIQRRQKFALVIGMFVRSRHRDRGVFGGIVAMRMVW